MEKNFVDLLELSDYLAAAGQDLGGWDAADDFFLPIPSDAATQSEIADALESLDAEHCKELDATINSWYLDTAVKPSQLISSLRKHALQALCLLRFLNAGVQIPAMLGRDSGRQTSSAFSMRLECDGFCQAIRWALIEFWRATHATTLRTYAAHLRQATS